MNWDDTMLLPGSFGKLFSDKLLTACTVTVDQTTQMSLRSICRSLWAKVWKKKMTLNNSVGLIEALIVRSVFSPSHSRSIKRSWAVVNRKVVWAGRGCVDKDCKWLSDPDFIPGNWRSWNEQIATSACWTLVRLAQGADEVWTLAHWSNGWLKPFSAAEYPNWLMLDSSW